MSDAARMAIRTENLTKIYRQRLIALNCVNLSVEPGTILGVLGANGAGKTTLIKMLLGLQRPTAGKVFLFGKPMSPGSALLRQRMGYLPADPHFPPAMTPIRYLDYVGRLGGMLHRARRAKLASLMRAVDLVRVAGERIEDFSTGMRTRLAIAASLMYDPDVLIWDEPSQGLDAEARGGLMELARQLAETKTLVLCSHFLADIESVCQRTIVLDQGQVIFDGSIEDLKGSANKPSLIDLGLVGDKREITEAIRSIQSFDELSGCKQQKTRLKLEIKPDASHATALANVLVTLADHKIDITDVRVSSEHSEQVLSNVLRREGSRGLVRAHQTVDT